MSKFAFLTAALLLIPSPVLAQIVFDDTPAPPVVPAKAKGKSDVDKVVCRSQDTLGSRLQAHQVCMTKDQWFRYEQENKQEVAGWQARTPAQAAH